MTRHPPGFPDAIAASAIRLDRPGTFIVSGKGTCTKMRLDFGDGSPTEDLDNVDLTANPKYTHTFTGWGGGKTVTAEGITNCVGKVNTRFTIEPSVFTLGYVQPVSTACVALPNRPALDNRALVHVTALPTPVINFGCPFNGCVYGADGKNPSTAGIWLSFSRTTRVFAGLESRHSGRARRHGR